MSADRSPAHRRLAEHLVGAKIALSIRALAEYRIADLLAGDPQTVETMAQTRGLDPDTLRRVLRALAQFGVFEELPDGRFANTDVSALLEADRPDSLRETFLFLNHDVTLKSWLRLEDTLKDGRSRFVEANGAPLFRLFGDDARLSEYFGKAMNNIYGREGARIAAGFDFGRFDSVIDLGGGRGHVLAAILNRYDGIKGALFDIPPTAALARDFLSAQGFGDRCDVIDGDFFQSVPGGYEAYIVKAVIHDWDDAQSIEILSNCRKVMSADARLLIIEEIVRPGEMMGHPNKFVDLDLLMNLDGRERTQAEYEALVERAGLRLVDVVHLPDSFSDVIEAAPV